MQKIDFEKQGGLVPAIIQDADSCKVLMLGYMNRAAYERTLSEKKVCFYSRSRKQLWTKGETSGNYLYLVNIFADCDGDTLLVKARPEGPVCHTGNDTCFNGENNTGFIHKLEKIIQQRKRSGPEGSYTVSLFSQGMEKIAAKLGEEAVEVVIDAVAGRKERVLEEAADLVYHLLVLLTALDLGLSDVAAVLEKRHK